LIWARCTFIQVLQGETKAWGGPAPSFRMAIIASFWAKLPKCLQFRTGPIRDRAGKSCQIRPPSRLKDEFVHN
ncbi:MAG: hypothetical protein QF393_14135, partial [Rhodospirillales bacterium]|nr:hypothetical protein [Rhodospirillales bacterium]MDP6643351.1 hypothetical protein [Rhodospirillales bacterium]